MNAEEVAAFLHFGAESGRLEPTTVTDSNKFNGNLGVGYREANLSFNESEASVESPEQMRIKLEEEIRMKTLELESLNAFSPTVQRRGSREPMRIEEKGFSTQQITELFQLFQAMQGSSGCPASERVCEQRLIDIAPKFDLKDANASWRAFEVFFDVNRVIKNENKFNILNGKLPWETMRQFGKENPNSGGNLKKLETFLKAYSKQSSPSMYHRDAIGKYGHGSLLRNVLHEAKSMADLDRNERIKLNAYLLSTGSNQKLIETHMHLPVDTFFAKISQKWNESTPPLPRDSFNGRASPPRPYREYKNQAYYNRQQQSTSTNYRQKLNRGSYSGPFGKNASQSAPRNGEISRMRAEPQEARLVQETVVTYPNNEPLGN